MDLGHITQSWPSTFSRPRFQLRDEGPPIFDSSGGPSFLADFMIMLFRPMRSDKPSIAGNASGRTGEKSILWGSLFCLVSDSIVQISNWAAPFLIHINDFCCEAQKERSSPSRIYVARS
jgi:hypothetical protein